MNIRSLLLWFLVVWGAILSWCAPRPSWDISALPDLFAVMPNDFDQILHIQVDDDILALMWTQYPDSAPVIQEFQWIQEIWVRQSSAWSVWESLLFVQGKDVDINQLAALWLVALDPNYQAFTLPDDIQVYGTPALIQSKQYTWVSWDKLMTELTRVSRNNSGNLYFVSRSTVGWLQWLALQFASKLQGTVGVLRLGNRLPNGEARMLFSSGTIKTDSEKWNARTATQNIPIHASTHGLATLFGMDWWLAKTFLPFVLNQYLGDSTSLLSENDYETLITGLDGSLSIDIVPNALGMWWRVIFDESKMFDVFDHSYPVIDGKVKTELFPGTGIDGTKEATRILWNASADTWSGTLVSLPVLSISKWADLTDISYMMINEFPVSSQTISMPWSTLAVATVDFNLLTSMMWIPAGELITTGDKKNIDLEVIGNAQEDIVRILLK